MNGASTRRLPGLDDDDLLTLKCGTLRLAEAAQRLGISIARIRRAAAIGQIPAIRIGRTWLVLRAPFERMLLGQAHPEGPM